MKQYFIQVTAKDAGPLVNLLVRHLGINEKTAMNLIGAGSVWNEKKAERIKDGNYAVSNELILVNKPLQELVPYPFSPQDIKYEDDTMCICYKHPGFSTVPTPYSDIASLSHAITLHYGSQKNPGNVTVINRLDVPTHGLVVFGLNRKTGNALQSMFKERNIRKYYLVRTEYLQNPESFYRFNDTLIWKGKPKSANSLFYLINTDTSGATFLVRPLTGRTHQIRKHCRRYLAPVHGDQRYGSKMDGKPFGLLCFAYIFTHPRTGEKISVKFIPETLRSFYFPSKQAIHTDNSGN